MPDVVIKTPIPTNSGTDVPVATCAWGICPNFAAETQTARPPTLTPSQAACVPTLDYMPTQPGLITNTPTVTLTPSLTYTPSLTPTGSPCSAAVYAHNNAAWSGGAVATGCTGFYVKNNSGNVPTTKVTLTMGQVYRLGGDALHTTAGSINLSGSMVNNGNNVKIEFLLGGVLQGSVSFKPTISGCTSTNPFSLAGLANIYFDTVDVYGQYDSSRNLTAIQLSSFTLYACPVGTVPTPTNTPTPSNTPTVFAGLTNTPGGYDCSVIIWRDDTPAVEYDGGVVVIDTTCYTFVPGIHIGWQTSTTFFGWHPPTMHIDRVRLCVDWLEIPHLAILGVDISLDLLMILPLAWVIRRLLQF